MRGYLEGYNFTVTDHQSLQWLQKLEEPTGQLARWIFELQQFDYEVRYRKESANKVADAFSRTPETWNIGHVQCDWYRRIAERVHRCLDEVPDYRLQDGKLERHILHDVDFSDVAPADQWKHCVPGRIDLPS